MTQEKPGTPPQEGKSDDQAKAQSADRNHKKSTQPRSSEPMAPYDSSEAGGPLPEIDEGPRPGPVDEIQEALFEAAQSDLPTELELEDLSKPSFDPDDLLADTPVDDEVQEAIDRARREGRLAEVDFEALPGPSLPEPKKRVKLDQEPSSPEAPPQPRPEPVPPPEPQPEPEPEVLGPDPTPTLSDFWLLLALFVTFRLLTLFLLKPGGFIRDWSDFDTYFGIAALSDYALFPYLDFWLEWPPLVPWLSVAAYKLALLLPPWQDDPRLWFVLILGTVFVVFEVGNFVLIYRLAQRLFQRQATVTRVLWFYVGLFPPIYAMLGFFDGVALFFMLLALEFMFADRRFLSAIAIGVGFMVKIIPILMLPVVLRRLWHRYRGNNREAGIEMGLYAVVFGLAVMALLIPFIILPALNGSPQWWTVSFRSLLGRSSWETIWAVAEGYYGFGQVGGNRLNPNVSQLDFAIHQGGIPGLWILITFAFAALYAYLFQRPANYARPRNLIAFAGLTVTIFMLYSKGYSPQFLVYLLPFIILLMPTGRGLVYALILTGLNVLEQPIYFVLLPRENWLLIFIVVARFLMLIVLALEFALILWPAEKRLARLVPAQKRAPLVLGGLAALALIILTPLTMLAYTNNQIRNTSLGTFVGFMEDQAAGERLILSDQSTYRQIYPHLHDVVDLQLASFDPMLTEQAVPGSRAATPAELLQGSERVWILPTGPNQAALENIIANGGDALASYDFGEVGTLSLYTGESNPIPRIAPARFIGGVELLDHHVETTSGAVEVTLYWRALEPQSQMLTVFAQLLNSDGQLVASHDSIPQNGAAPVTEWTVGEVQADSHLIRLPSDLTPGEYMLIVGMYNRFNERIRAIDPQGVGLPNRAVPLDTLQLP